MTYRMALAVAVVLLACNAVSAESPPWSAEMAAAPGEPGAATSPLRLIRASYEIDVLGSLAVGELTQVFVNDNPVDVSATYVAHPPGIFVETLEAEVAGRTLELRTAAKSRPTGRAATASRTAQKRGRPAERAPQPSQTIEMEAGDAVTVRAVFKMGLPLRGGRFVLRLPAVTGPVPPVAEGEERPAAVGPPGTISVAIHHEEPLPYAESRSHEVITVYEGDRTVIELAQGDSDSREFELEFALGMADDATLLGNVTSTQDDVHEVIAVLTPPMEPPDDAVRAKQVLFVLDRSGSMANGKLDQAREALVACLEKLRPVDQFNITVFNNEYRMLDEEPVSVEGAALGNATGWLERLRHAGGTTLLPALGATFEQPESDEHHRMIVLLTDGAVQDRVEVLELLELELGEGRMFVIGIGEDVSRKTVQQMAEYGRGIAVFAADPEALDAVMSAMFESVSEPLAWDLALDWGGAEVESIEPARLPDLYAGRPVTIRARLRGELPERLTVEATTTTGLRQFTTNLAPAANEKLSRLGPR
jgi:Ca-activated chloride channel family protein